jgi:hypothetical protein
MRILMCVLAATAVLTACGGGNSKKTATPAASAPAKAATPTTSTQPKAATPTTSPPAKAATVAPAACPTPPAVLPSTVTYQAPATSQTQAVLNAVNVATSNCTDIATFTFAGSDVPGYEAKYVQSTTTCGSGEPVTTGGPAQLTLRFEPAVAHDANGNVTVNTLALTPNLTSIKELKSTCDFEGVVAWVIGTESRYYTVTTAQNPSRIIVSIYQ